MNRDALLDLSDRDLLGLCRIETYRASGPGGQKRNKTDSAVRITHLASGLAATAVESRSQHDNRKIALRRLRHRLALNLRQPIDPRQFTLPQGWTTSSAQPDLRRMAMILDILACAGWSVSDAAHLLGVTTGRLVGWLRDDEKVWAQVNQQRALAGLRPLVGR